MRPLPLALLALFVGPLSAQDDPPIDTYGHSRHGSEFDEGPRQAAHLMQGISPQVHFPVTGLGELAQKFFDQGVCQQHGFWYFEAERSFRQVALLQPECAMAYWGMCVANLDHSKRAAGFAAQMVQRAAAASERERMWIDAWARFYQIGDDERRDLQSGDEAKIKAARDAIDKRSEKRNDNDQERSLTRDLVRGIEAIVAKYPDDPEAKAFLVVQIWRNVEHGNVISSHGAVDALLDQLFALAPMHPAHHFRIHLWDHEKPERALRSAALLGHTAPGIAHQWHMAGHIFADLDRHADAAWQQEAAARVDHAFMRADRVIPYEIHNYGHNQEWLCRSLMHIGAARAAVDLAKNMVELPRHPSRNKVEQDDQIAGYGRQRLCEALTAFEMWDELLACSEQGFLEPGGTPRDQLQRLQALGTAHFRLGQVAAGEAVLAEADTLVQGLRGERASAINGAEEAAWKRGDGNDKVREAIDKAAHEKTEAIESARTAVACLLGEQALAANDGKLALEQFAKAPQTSPATLARAHQLVGAHDAAIAALKAALKPGRVAPLARYVHALWLGGNQDEAKSKFAELRTLAGTADLDVPLLQRLLPIAEAAGLPPDWRTPAPPRDDVGERPPLDSLGPFRWSPVAAPDLDLPLADGSHFHLADRGGKATLLVFYLGFGCQHCIAQLRAFAPKAGEFAAQGIDIIAIGTEPLAKVIDLVSGTADQDRFPFKLACDPSLAGFKTYRAYDDFEKMPLHSTVLIDGNGRLRWQDISYQPFTEIDWLLRECQRLLALPIGAAVVAR
jgi:peroxiredoxin